MKIWHLLFGLAVIAVFAFGLLKMQSLSVQKEIVEKTDGTSSASQPSRKSVFKGASVDFSHGDLKISKNRSTCRRRGVTESIEPECPKSLDQGRGFKDLQKLEIYSSRRRDTVFLSG